MEMPNSRKPIDFAFLDSGTGGLPYLFHLQKKSPHSSSIYLADSAHFPYGTKTPAQIIECANKAVSLILKNFSPRAVVIACNTISVTALNSLRANFSEVQFVGTVPAIKLAASTTRNKKIGLLATSATVKNQYIKNLQKEFANDCEIFFRGDDNLVSFAEKHFFTSTSEQKIQAVLPAIEFFRACGCDTIILGCTHFLHLHQEFQKICVPDINVVDSREGVANQALRIAGCNTNSATSKISSTVFVSDFYSDTEQSSYNFLCQKLQLSFGGMLK